MYKCLLVLGRLSWLVSRIVFVNNVITIGSCVLVCSYLMGRTIILALTVDLNAETLFGDFCPVP